MEFFGFELRRKQNEEKKNLDAIVPDNSDPTDDGSLVVSAGGSYGMYVDIEGSAKTESELVTRYRDMAGHPEVEGAIDDIINEAINSEVERIVEIVLDELPVTDRIKKMIEAEFETIFDMLDFNHQGYDIFKRWYVDGRLYYQAVIDKDNPRAGIQEMRYIDPRKIKKIKEVRKKRVGSKENALTSVTEVANEFYMYSEKGFTGPSATSNQTAGIRIAKDSIVYVTSGLTDSKSSLVLSYLHKAIKPLNQLKSIEDASVIYRLSRAPERRIFYIDVGNLPKMKAEQYLKDMMTRHKNKLVYDMHTGEIRDDRKFMTMLEDFWLPRREGGRGTEITTLPGGQNLGEIEDIKYFQDKLFRSLNVPISRMQPDQAFNLGRSSEISRDEVKFAKFIDRLRVRFSSLFTKTLEKQLLLKGIITSEDWKIISTKFKYLYARDNFFSELKDIEVQKERMNVLDQIVPYVGTYYSKEWVKRHVLKQSDEEIEEMAAEIEADPEIQAQQQQQQQQADAEMQNQEMQQQQAQTDMEAKQAQIELTKAQAKQAAKPQPSRPTAK
jgi:Bacteriophage T4-like portal protein (Gp20)